MIWKHSSIEAKTVDLSYGRSCFRTQAPKTRQNGTNSQEKSYRLRIQNKKRKVHLANDRFQDQYESYAKEPTAQSMRPTWLPQFSQHKPCIKSKCNEIDGKVKSGKRLRTDLESKNLKLNSLRRISNERIFQRPGVLHVWEMKKSKPSTFCERVHNSAARGLWRYRPRFHCRKNEEILNTYWKKEMERDKVWEHYDPVWYRVMHDEN